MKVEVVLERQKNHLKSVEFAEKRLRSIRVEIDDLIKGQKKYGHNEFEFLLEIAKMLIKARRTLAYSCPIRFYLKGPNKQKFFDFMISDLERYCELLTKSSERTLTEVTELDQKNQLFLGQKFTKFREEM
jgi:hypothetical protein